VEPTYKIYAKGFRVGPLPFPELVDSLRETPAPPGSTVALSTPMGDQFGPIEHFPELVPYIAGPSPQPLPISEEFVGPRPYVPNHIPFGSRAVAALFIPMGCFLLWSYISTGKTVLSAGKHGPKIDVAGWWGLPIGALALGIIITSLTCIIDHCDKRPNEHVYRRSMTCGLVLLLGGKIAALLVIHHLKNP
jgi:hypothetical protein